MPDFRVLQVRIVDKMPAQRRPNACLLLLIIELSSTCYAQSHVPIIEGPTDVRIGFTSQMRQQIAEQGAGGQGLGGYYVPITIGGRAFNALLDTGSSELAAPSVPGAVPVAGTCTTDGSVMSSSEAAEYQQYSPGMLVPDTTIVNPGPPGCLYSLANTGEQPYSLSK